jgi:hypothetical protein
MAASHLTPTLFRLILAERVKDLVAKATLASRLLDWRRLRVWR